MWIQRWDINPLSEKSQSYNGFLSNTHSEWSGSPEKSQSYQASLSSGPVLRQKYRHFEDTFWYSNIAFWVGYVCGHIFDISLFTGLIPAASLLPSQQFNVWSSSAGPANKTPFKWSFAAWRADGGPCLVVFGSSLPSSTKKNVARVGPPLTKLSGSAHG